MAVCARGHDSADEDFCDVCGLALDAPASSAALDPVAARAPVERECPVCGAALDGRFCEDCGADSLASPPPEPASVSAVAATSTAAGEPVEAITPGGASASGDAVAPALGAGDAPNPEFSGGSVTEGTEWIVVVSADRRYHDQVRAEGGPDADAIGFPPYCPERRFKLRGNEITIGRRSRTRGIEPDIDLTGPPEDPGVSRLHAILVSSPAGWSVVDMNSANGTYLNYQRTSLDPNTPRPLSDGDRIHVGAWTTITVKSS